LKVCAKSGVRLAMLDKKESVLCPSRIKTMTRGCDFVQLAAVRRPSKLHLRPVFTHAAATAFREERRPQRLLMV